MSEILSNIVVEQNNINFTPNNNNINVTPEAIQLSIFTGSSPGAGYSSNGELLYNNQDLIDGVPNTSFSNGNLLLGNVANIQITGGSSGEVLQTDGNGVLSWGDANYANFAGNVVNASQPSITSLGTLTALNVNGVANLGNVSNVKITGGVNGYFLQTDGAGNLTFAAAGGGGNGSPGGSNTQIQYNDNGLFGGNTGFTFNEVTGNVNIPGSLVVTSNITGTLLTAAQPQITSLGSLTGLEIVGPLNVSSNTIFGNLLSANVANITGNVNAIGNVNANNFNGTLYGNVNGNLANVTGSGANLSNLNASNLSTGTVPTSRLSGTYNISITGSVASANVVTDNAQPAITSVGTLTDLRISNTSIHLGNNSASTGYQGVLTVAIGNNAGSANLKNEAIAIGNSAGIGTSNNVFYGQYAISIGTNSGSNADTGAISIGTNSGNTAGSDAISIGSGSNAQGDLSVAIGSGAKAIPNSSVSIGNNAQSGGINGIAIGTSATTSGANAIAIGQQITAGVNTIVLNATNSSLTGGTANALFIKPVRTVNSTAGLNQLYYNSSTGEIVVYVP